jgi:hypothetical protein
MKTNYFKFIGYALLALLFITASYSFISTGEPVKEVLGALGTEGEYSVVTTTGESWEKISSVPVILHRVIFGTANDELYLANATTTPSTNGAFYIKATVPATFDMDMIMSSGMVAYVTSTRGVIFVTSPYK